MGRKIAGALECVLILLVVSACCYRPESRYLYPWDCSHERLYTVFGRITNTQFQPIGDCKVILIRREICWGPTDCCTEVREIDRMPLTQSSATGDFSFQFEPHGANNLWIYFDARDKGYAPRFFELSHLIGKDMFSYPGTSPIAVGIVMERIPGL